MYSRADAEFAARFSGMPEMEARAMLGELGWVQLVAAAVPLVTGLAKKRKLKKRRKRQEAIERMQGRPMPASGLTVSPARRQAQQSGGGMLAAQMQALSAQVTPPPSSSTMSQLALPLAAVGGVLALVFILRRR